MVCYIVEFEKTSIKAWCKEDNQRSNAARLSIQSCITESKAFSKLL
jgi:hypothetical protein